MNTTVQVGPYEVGLKPPLSFAIRWDLAMAMGAASSVPEKWRLRAAALGMCWRGEGAPRASLQGVDFISYAGALLDELMSRGIRPAQVMAASTVAYRVVTDGLITDADVKAAQDFMNAQTPRLTG